MQEGVIYLDRFSPQALIQPLPFDSGPGWGMGFTRPGDVRLPPLKRPQNREFYLDTGQPFEVYLLLSNGFEQPIDVAVTLILDYRQVPFSLDGKEGRLFLLSLPPQKDLYLPLRVPISQPGMHDIFALAFAHPLWHPQDESLRFSELYPGLFGFRAVVFVGSERTPVRNLAPDMIGEPYTRGEFDYLRVGMALLPQPGEQRPPADRQFAVARLRKNIFRFQVMAKNEEDTPVTYAIVAFLNFQQAFLDDDGVLVAQLAPGHQAVKTVSLHVPEDSQRYELQLVYVMDPYRSLLRHEALSPFVFGSVRALLERP